MTVDVKEVLKSNFTTIDEDTLEYFSSMIETGSVSKESLIETLGPFLESYNLVETEEEIEQVCDKISNELNLNSLKKDNDDLPQILDQSIQMSNISKNMLNDSDIQNVEALWGFESIRKKRNDVIEFTEAASQRNERKLLKEQRKWLDDLEKQFVGEEDNDKLSTMVLPDFNSSKNKEKDIHVHNFNITYGGNILLEGADLKLVFNRRYGLIGKNGIGKTTLLKHIANFDIEGFPRHHRILHVKQEVKSTGLSVIETVLESDVERISLMDKEKELNEQLKNVEKDEEIKKIISKLEEVNERLNLLNSHTAESRASVILNGLQFTDEMIHAPTNSLSGGWRMRVALACALFIEPDLLMLDEPTNHLDLEAVLWLENYLLSYPKTVLLVSHDRAFLNEICTDIILFQNLKLNYYKGNYDNFEGVRKEMRVVQQKQHEAQQVKLNHMQEFVDKFRFNAKRSSLVQSRIKLIEKETIIEAVEDEEVFQFRFEDAGQLGRPIIQIEDVSFGYESPRPSANSSKEPLFRGVNLNIDQSSRIALVGPNGAGKSTLLNLIQSKITPQEGIIRVNPQLKLGIFTQYHIDSFNLTISPLANLLNLYPGSTEAEVRAHLGKYQVSGNDAIKPMKFSSGGQKSRVAFAALTFSKPHVVIMDEPTNHLDMSAIDALIDALKNFTGGVLIVSHDQHFITNVCNEIWVIANRQIKNFNGEFNDYKKSVLKRK